MNMSDTHAADTEYLVRQAMTTGYQWSSLLAPPIYIAFIVSRRGRGELSLNRILRSTWVGGLAGAGLSGGGAFARYAYSNPDSVRARRIETAYDTGLMRRNDHSTIGGVLAAVVTPAILWKRANILNLILGGAGIGSGLGLVAHFAKSAAGDAPAKANIVVPVAPSDTRTR